MAETLVSSGRAEGDGERLPEAGYGAGDHAVERVALTEKARFERELAALDLTDAAQAAARSASASAQSGDAEAQAEMAARLYASADRHRLTAVHLKIEAMSAAPENE